MFCNYKTAGPTPVKIITRPLTAKLLHRNLLYVRESRFGPDKLHKKTDKVF